MHACTRFNRNGMSGRILLLHILVPYPRRLSRLHMSASINFIMYPLPIIPLNSAIKCPPRTPPTQPYLFYPS